MSGLCKYRYEIRVKVDNDTYNIQIIVYGRNANVIKEIKVKVSEYNGKSLNKHEFQKLYSDLADLNKDKIQINYTITDIHGELVDLNVYNGNLVKYSLRHTDLDNELSDSDRINMPKLNELISILQTINESSIRTLSFYKFKNFEHPNNICFRFTVDDINKGIMPLKLFTRPVLQYEYDQELRDLKVCIGCSEFEREFIYNEKSDINFDQYKVEISKKLKEVKGNNELARRLNLMLEGKI